MDVVKLHESGVEHFGSLVARVGTDQWSAPTPCVGWDVRALVNHLVYENRWTPPLVEGRTVAEVGDEFEGDLLGDDPMRAWDRSATEAVTAVSTPGAMARTVHLSFGDVPGEEYAMQLFADHLVHGWDLARAIGADERLAPGLVAACAAWYAEREALYRGGGAVGDRVEVSEDADEQTRLLAAFGRRA